MPTRSKKTNRGAARTVVLMSRFGVTIGDCRTGGRETEFRGLRLAGAIGLQAAGSSRTRGSADGGGNAKTFDTQDMRNASKLRLHELKERAMLFRAGLENPASAARDPLADAADERSAILHGLQRLVSTPTAPAAALSARAAEERLEHRASTSLKGLGRRD